ncbi:MAG: hypothetical protein U5R31_00560 [Acidimicrobiia bacterium]|nr:hypothetical protein [Acidimicrobiia bacterium]
MIGGLTPDQRRSWHLGIATAAAVLTDPAGARRLAASNLETMRAAHGHRADRWLEEWQRLVEGPLDGIVDALTAPTGRAAELRRELPLRRAPRRGDPPRRVRAARR